MSPEEEKKEPKLSGDFSRYSREGSELIPRYFFIADFRSVYTYFKTVAFRRESVTFRHRPTLGAKGGLEKKEAAKSRECSLEGRRQD